MSDCLHCDIIQLVQERIDRGEGDLPDLAAMIGKKAGDSRLPIAASVSPGT